MNRLHQSAVARLLEREFPEGYLAERTEIVSVEKPEIATDTKSVLIFRLGSEWLALPTTILQEIAGPGKLHRVPHRHGALAGLVNVRGELLLCASLEVLLHLETKSDRRPSSGTNGVSHERLVVCNHKGNRVAFPVHEVFGVHHFLLRDLRDVPATLSRAAAIYTAGVFQWRDRTVGSLDEELLFHTLNKSFA